MRLFHSSCQERISFIAGFLPFNIVQQLLLTEIYILLCCNPSPHVSATVPTDEERADDREDTGWKLVHAVGPDEGFASFCSCNLQPPVLHLGAPPSFWSQDVFRPPAQYPMLLCAAVGTGAQVSHPPYIYVPFPYLS